MKLLILLLLILPLSAAPVPDLSVGRPFPNFSLEEISSGESKGLRSSLGKKTILHIFASW
ncbi:MAG: hypothetical protein ACJAQT_002211 [Akkermansiaceae bacterium]|jgi:hypothetical protein